MRMAHIHHHNCTTSQNEVDFQRFVDRVQLDKLTSLWRDSQSVLNVLLEGKSAVLKFRVVELDSHCEIGRLNTLDSDVDGLVQILAEEDLVCQSWIELVFGKSGIPVAPENFDLPSDGGNVNLDGSD